MGIAVNESRVVVWFWIVICEARAEKQTDKRRTNCSRTTEESKNLEGVIG